MQGSGGRLSWNYNLLKHHIVLFFLYEFFLETVSHKGFNEAISIQEYMSYLLFSPLGFLKVIFKTYWMSYLLFSHQGFLRRYQGHYASLYFSHWVLGEVIRIWSTDHVIDLQTCLWFFLLKVFSYEFAMRQKSIYVISFSPIFPTGF